MFIFERNTHLKHHGKIWPLDHGGYMVLIGSISHCNNRNDHRDLFEVIFEPDIHFPSSLQLRKEDISKILVIWFRRTAGWSELIPQGWLVTIKQDGEQIVPRIVRPAHPTGEQTTKSNLSGAGWCRLKRLPVLPVQTFPMDRKSINSTLNKNGYYVPHSCSVFFHVCWVYILWFWHEK